MKKRLFILLSSVLMLTILTSLMASCTKNSGGNTQASGSGTKTAATATKTAVTSTAQKTASASSAAAASKSEAATAGLAEDTSDSSSLESDESIIVNLDTVKQEDTFDMGGKTIILSTRQASVDYFTEASTPVFNARMHAAEKKYNCKFEIKQKYDGTTYNNLIKSNALAGTKYADISFTSTGTVFPEWVKLGLVVPIDDYIDFNLPIMQAFKRMSNGLLFKGKHYAYISNLLDVHAAPGVMFNRDIIEREGQPDILDLIENQQWTWQALLDIAQNCTKDINGDGIIDQWGIVTNDYSRYITGVMASNGVQAVVDGQYTLNTGPALRAIQFAVDLCLNYKVCKIDNSAWNTKLYPSGNAAMFWAWRMFGSNRSFITSGLRSSIAPDPMGPDVNVYQQYGLNDIFVILSSCEWPKEVAVIFNEINMTWDENGNPGPEIMQNAKYRLEKDGIPIYKTLADNMAYDEREYNVSWLVPGTNHYQVLFTYGYPNVMTIVGNNIAKTVLTGQQSVSQAVTAAESKIMDIVNNYN